MSVYLAPDIYIEEVPGGSRPIQAVGTRTAGFVGVAPDVTKYRYQARACNNWSQFWNEFGGPELRSTDLSQAIYGFFLNGGSRCYVVNIGAEGNLTTGLQELATIDEVAIVAAPGFTGAAAYDAVLSHCEQLADRVAILDPPAEVADLQQLTTVATVPLPGNPAADTGGATAPAPGLRPRESAFGTFYFPRLLVRDPLSSQEVVVPPSGHLAGIWARSDAMRGVHKAPANEIIRGALNLTYRLTREEQGELNQQGVNGIRFFVREGIRVWGARTLASASSEWRYLNVRRLFNMIEESIAESTRWIIFEPNDRTLWKSIRRDVSAFLTRLWRDGALMGTTPAEAFFVKCDAETNPPEVIDAGQVVTLIGIAPVKPAEFIVFKISQYSGGSETEEQGVTNA